jgi:hypothetical protein
LQSCGEISSPLLFVVEAVLSGGKVFIFYCLNILLCVCVEMSVIVGEGGYFHHVKKYYKNFEGKFSSTGQNRLKDQD